MPQRRASQLPSHALQIGDGEGAVVASSNNRRDTQETEVKAIGAQPAKDKESTIITTLGPGSYTALVR
ncbi:hypothetical protein BH18VER1_BH18VER1_11780 [soil metagenome]